jgi:hypothetical protein
MLVPAWLLVALTIGAVARLTRLITADKITEPIRNRLYARWGEESKRAYLIGCDFCCSVYIAPPVAAVVVIWPDNRAVLAGILALTASQAAGMIAKHE